MNRERWGHKFYLSILLVLFLSPVLNAQSPPSASPAPPVSVPLVPLPKVPPNRTAPKVFIFGSTATKTQIANAVGKATSETLSIDTVQFAALAPELGPNTILFIESAWGRTDLTKPQLLNFSDAIYTAQKRGVPIISLGSTTGLLSPDNRLPDQYILVRGPKRIPGKIFTSAQLESLPTARSEGTPVLLLPTISGQVLHPGTGSKSSEFYLFSSSDQASLARGTQDALAWAERSRFGPLPAYKHSPGWVPISDLTSKVDREFKPYARISYRIVPYLLIQQTTQYDIWNLDITVTIEPGKKLHSEDLELGYEDWLTKEVRMTTVAESTKPQAELIDYKPTTTEGRKTVSFSVGVSLGVTTGAEAKMGFDFEIPDRGVLDLSAPPKQRTKSLYRVQPGALMASTTARFRQVSSFRVSRGKSIRVLLTFEGMFVRRTPKGYEVTSPWQISPGTYEARR